MLNDIPKQGELRSLRARLGLASTLSVTSINFHPVIPCLAFFPTCCTCGLLWIGRYRTEPYRMFSCWSNRDQLGVSKLINFKIPWVVECVNPVGNNQIQQFVIYRSWCYASLVQEIHVFSVTILKQAVIQIHGCVSIVKKHERFVLQ